MEGKDLVIRVRDTGPGIPKEIEGRLFQSFVTAGKVGGTGLGLAIVKKIVEEHGGSVTVGSDTDGTEFVMRLPQPDGKSTGGASKKRQSSAPPKDAGASFKSGG
jgi:signal transduction histidine kinase